MVNIEYKNVKAGVRDLICQLALCENVKYNLQEDDKNYKINLEISVFQFLPNDVERRKNETTM